MEQNGNVQTGAAAQEETVQNQKPQKKENKVLNIIVNVILVLAIALGIFCSFTAFIAKSGNSVPSFFGYKPFAIQTDSMAPFFNKGDLVIDKEVDPDTLQVGDVITFWTVIQGERALNTHRIVGIQDGGSFRSFTTKGDNNSIEDGLTVHESEIVGKYVTHIPYLGSVIDFLQTSTGFLLVIVLPCAIFFLYQLIVFFKALFAYQAEKTRVQYQGQMAAEQAQQARAQAAQTAQNVQNVHNAAPGPMSDEQFKQFQAFQQFQQAQAAAQAAQQAAGQMNEEQFKQFQAFQQAQAAAKAAEQAKAAGEAPAKNEEKPQA